MSIDALYRAVWEHPDDDAIKLVLADALMAIGDPRGELIRLHARWFGELSALFELMPPDAIEVVTIWNVPRSQHDDLQMALMHFGGITAELRPMSPDEDRWYEARLMR